MALMKPVHRVASLLNDSIDETVGDHQGCRLQWPAIRRIDTELRIRFEREALAPDSDADMMPTDPSARRDQMR
jgi:hypothetical protein